MKLNVCLFLMKDEEVSEKCNGILEKISNITKKM